MNARRLLLLGLAAGLLSSAVACGGSSHPSMPPPPPAMAPAFETTVADLVKNHTSDTETPASIDSLKLDGSDIEDIHEFDSLLGI